MGFGGEVDHRVHAVSGQQVHDQVAVADIALDEPVAGIAALQVREVEPVARVGQLVEVDDGPVGMAAEHEPDEVGADEAAAAGDEEFHGSVARKGLCPVGDAVSPINTSRRGKRQGAGR
jgi:hypothetical protein